MHYWVPESRTDIGRAAIEAAHELWLRASYLQPELRERTRDFKVIKRISACVDDLRWTVGVLAPLHEELYALDTERHDLGVANDAEGFRAWFHAKQPRHEALSGQVVAQFKAMLFFGRALQDAIYTALLLMGRQTASRASMSDCMKNERSRVRRAIERDLPGYGAWFDGMKRLRNDVKFGAEVGGSFRSRGGGPEFGFMLTHFREGQPVTTIRPGVVLVLDDVVALLQWSSRLLEFARTFGPDLIHARLPLDDSASNG